MVTHQLLDTVIQFTVYCTDCKSRDLTRAKSETYCNQCGLVLEDQLLENNCNIVQDPVEVDIPYNSSTINPRIKRIIDREALWNSPKESNTVKTVKRQLKYRFGNEHKSSIKEGISMLNKLRNHTTPQNKRLLRGYPLTLTAAVVSELIFNKIRGHEVSRKELLKQIQNQFDDIYSPCHEIDCEHLISELSSCVNKIIKGFSQVFRINPISKANSRIQKLELIIENLKEGMILSDQFELPANLLTILPDFYRYPISGQPLNTFHCELLYQYCRRHGNKISRRSIFEVGLGIGSKAKTEHWSKDIIQILNHWEECKHEINC